MSSEDGASEPQVVAARKERWDSYKRRLSAGLSVVGRGLYAWLREIIVGGIPLFSLWFVNYLTSKNEPYPREIFIWSVVVSGGTLLSTKVPPENKLSFASSLIFVMKGVSTLILLAGAFGYALLTAKVVTENITVARTVLLIALTASLAIAIVEAAKSDGGSG